MAALTWWTALLVLLVLGTIATVVVIERRSGSRPGTDVGATKAVRVTRIIAILYAVVTMLGTVADALQRLLSDAVSVRLPVKPFWPSLPSTVEVTGTTADVVGGGFDHAVVTVAGLDTAPRVWLAAGDVLQGATNVVIAVVVVMLCTSIIRQDPFRPALTRGINLTATSIIAGGLGWQVCDAVAGGLASSQVLRATGWSLDTAEIDWTDIRQVIGLPMEGHEWTLDFWPIWVGLALFAVAAVFRYGQELQRDSDGLV